MKKNYTAPEAGLLCFAPVETLATDIKFGDLVNLGNGGTLDGTNKGNAAVESGSDIKINI